MNIVKLEVCIGGITDGIDNWDVCINLQGGFRIVDHFIEVFQNYVVIKDKDYNQLA